MRTPPRPGFLLVATRELRWMRRDRVALFLALGVPIIAFTILSLIFSNAVIRNLRVSVVDADRSPTSLTYVQAIASAPGVSVAERSSDMTSATHAIRSGDAIAAVYIPENFERDLVAGRRPQIVAFYNRQYFTPGNSASAAISNAIAAATATLPRTSNSELYAPGPLMVEQYVLTNPAAELRAVPATRHFAHGSSCRRRDRRRICGRFRVLATQPASLAQSGRRQPTHGPRWKTGAALRDLRDDDGRRRRHHP